MSIRVKPNPGIPRNQHWLSSAFGNRYGLARIRLRVRCAADHGSNWAQRSSLRGGSIVPCILAWRPHPPARLPPTHFPAKLVITPVFDIQGYSCLVARPSELSLTCCSGLPSSTSAGDPMCASSHFYHIGNGHRSRDWLSLASPMARLNQLRAGGYFRRFVCSLSLRPS